MNKILSLFFAVFLLLMAATSSNALSIADAKKERAVMPTKAGVKAVMISIDTSKIEDALRRQTEGYSASDQYTMALVMATAVISKEFEKNGYSLDSTMLNYYLDPDYHAAIKPLSHLFITAEEAAKSELGCAKLIEMNILSGDTIATILRLVWGVY